MTTTPQQEPAGATALESLKDIKTKLERAGAKIPLENKGTIESAMQSGLSMAMLLITEKIDGLESAASGEAARVPTEIQQEAYVVQLLLAAGHVTCEQVVKAREIAASTPGAAAPKAPASADPVAEPEGRCVRFTEPCECAPEAKAGCVTWRPVGTTTLTDARIMELWKIADTPCDANDHTTGPRPFARLVERELLAASAGKQAPSGGEAVPAPADGDGHIKHPYTLAELRAKIASNEYSAELLLQHAMLLLAQHQTKGTDPVYRRHTDAEALSCADRLNQSFPPSSLKDEAADHIRELVAVAQAAPPQAPAPAPEPVAWVPYLSDRADGVAGHYAIARWNPAGYREVWNLRNHRWASASDDVLCLEEADSLLRQIVIPTVNPVPVQQAFTEGHCAEKRKPGGCQLHNLHCGYPACDRKAVPQSPAVAPTQETPHGGEGEGHG